MDSATVEDFGRARRVSSTKDDTTIGEGRGSEEAIQARINQIKAQIEDTTSEYDREKLQERMAKLSGGVAVIKVGAPPRSSSRSARPGSRTLCPPPVPPSKKGLFLAAASLWFAPKGLWTLSKV